VLPVAGYQGFYISKGREGRGRRIEGGEKKREEGAREVGDGWERHCYLQNCIGIT